MDLSYLGSLVFLLLSSAAGSSQEKSFLQLRPMDVEILDRISSFSVSTSMECGRKCSATPGCKSFGFNSEMSACWLYPNLVHFTKQGNSAPGSRYFWRLLPSCPIHYMHKEGLCFKNLGIMTNRSHAEDLCQEEGGHLFLGDSAWKLTVLRHYTGDDNIALGASDSEEEGKWVWVDGSPLSNISELWDPPNPNNSGGVQHFLKLTPQGLDDTASSSSVRVVCQLPVVHNLLQ